MRAFSKEIYILDYDMSLAKFLNPLITKMLIYVCGTHEGSKSMIKKISFI